MFEYVSRDKFLPVTASVQNLYQQMSDVELNEALELIGNEAHALGEKNLHLDMARGKPSSEQTALSKPMLDMLDSSSDLCDGNSFADNYGDPWGLPSARKFAAQLTGVSTEQVIVNGSSSLNLMHDIIAHAYTHGLSGQKPWVEQKIEAAMQRKTIKFLCPVPGYDRHFAITQHYGFENIPVPMTNDGPRMDVVKELVESDDSVKGIWCVPRFANPSGITYSDEVVCEFAKLRPAAPDFRVYWDNAYAVHTMVPEAEAPQLLNIFEVLRSLEGNTTDKSSRNLVIAFASTAKITFPSSGMAWVSASLEDISEIQSAFKVARVSPEKISQLAHVRFLKDFLGVSMHMQKHARLLKPRFDLVEKKLQEGLGDLKVATWSHPKGGYFVSFDGPIGSARAIVSRANELGVKMTSAGATWPGGNDPFDTNIRIAPSYPTLEELDAALDVFVVAVKQVSARLAKVDRGQSVWG